MWVLVQYIEDFEKYLKVDRDLGDDDIWVQRIEDTKLMVISEIEDG